MKREWKNAEIVALEVQATALANEPVTGVDEVYIGDDSRKHYKVGVAYNSGSSKSLILSGEEAVEAGHELFD